MTWPELPYEAWRDTKETLRLYLQVAGKVRATLSPVEPGWGHAPFYLTARGATTSPIPHGGRGLRDRVRLRRPLVSVLFDRRRVDADRARASHGRRLPRRAPRPARAEGVAVEISAGPSDVEDGIPFAEDGVHGSYEPEWANRFWQVLLAVRGCSSRAPCALSGQDLARAALVGVARPRLQPLRRGRAAAGFWPGDERHPAPAFYAYTSPRPDGIEAAAVEPDAAAWSSELGEFVLPYDAVRPADPRAALLAFLDRPTAPGCPNPGVTPLARASSPEADGAVRPPAPSSGPS